MEKISNGFRGRVHAVVESIPKGRVMSYGQIATLCGSPRAARIVGGIAHFGDKALPWQRVVKVDGTLADGYPGGVRGHQAALEAEGVEFSDGKLNMSRYWWIP